MRPESIRWFDLTYLGSVALSAVDFVLERDALTAQLTAQFGESGLTLGAGIVTGTFVAWMAFLVLLWFLVARKRMAGAKWVIVLLVAIGLYALPTLFTGTLTPERVVSVLSLVLSLVAVYCLFRPDAKAWFAARESSDPGQSADG